ncbi:unnamed protein product [Discosporangium mesarthrocarpum]
MDGITTSLYNCYVPGLWYGVHSGEKASGAQVRAFLPAHPCLLYLSSPCDLSLVSVWRRKRTGCRLCSEQCCVCMCNFCSGAGYARGTHVICMACLPGEWEGLMSFVCSEQWFLWEKEVHPASGDGLPLVLLDLVPVGVSHLFCLTQAPPPLRATFGEVETALRYGTSAFLSFFCLA